MRVLVVEDEAVLSKQLASALGEAGYAVDCAADGERADFLAKTERYDAIVLDLGLPRIDGLTLLRRWREAGVFVPVLVLTARASWSEKVQGIDGGADDYVAKPFRMEEVAARLRALIRRASGQINPELRCGSLILDPRVAKVTLDGNPVLGLFAIAGILLTQLMFRHPDAPRIFHGLFTHVTALSIVAVLCMMAGLSQVRSSRLPPDQPFCDTGLSYILVTLPAGEREPAIKALAAGAGFDTIGGSSSTQHS